MTFLATKNRPRGQEESECTVSVSLDIARSVPNVLRKIRASTDPRMPLWSPSAGEGLKIRHAFLQRDPRRVIRRLYPPTRG